MVLIPTVGHFIGTISQIGNRLLAEKLGYILTDASLHDGHGQVSSTPCIELGEIDIQYVHYICSA
jgi:hypothetical protein